MNKDLSMLNDDDLMKVAGGYGEASIASGSFASSTGTALNLVVYWSVQDNGGQKVLKVTVSSSSYSLYCTGSACGVELVVNGMSYASGTPAIEYGGNSSFKTFVLEYLNEKMSGMAIRHVSTDEFPQVTADISVSDKDYVLTKENLSVTDSGTEITDFTLEQIEVSDLSLVFVLEKSGSMSGDRIEKSKEAIKSCISQLESGAQMGLVSFESDSTLECGLTDSGTIVSGSVDGIEASGGTNISAGLATGVELLAGRSGTKVIILLSDGQGSGSNLSEVVSEAAAQGIVIYTIGLPGCDEGTLQSIAANSGGQFIMVEDTAMLSATYDDIQSAVTNSYRLTYHVEGDKENRKITVVDAGSGHEAARYYSTVKPEPEVPADEPEDTNDTQVADFYRQIGGSEGGR